MLNWKQGSLLLLRCMDGSFLLLLLYQIHHLLTLYWIDRSLPFLHRSIGGNGMNGASIEMVLSSIHRKNCSKDSILHSPRSLRRSIWLAHEVFVQKLDELWKPEGVSNKNTSHNQHVDVGKIRGSYPKDCYKLFQSVDLRVHVDCAGSYFTDNVATWSTSSLECR